MPSAYVFTCPGQNGTTIPNGIGLAADGRLVPHCPSGGTWTAITYAEEVPQFDAAAWIQSPQGQQQFGGHFAAGFTLVAVAYVIGWGVRSLLSFIGR